MSTHGFFPAGKKLFSSSVFLILEHFSPLDRAFLSLLCSFLPMKRQIASCLPVAELQPEEDLLGAGVRGERVTPKKGGGNQAMDAIRTGSAGQHFVICRVLGLSPKMSDTSHQNMAVRPIYVYPDTSTGGVGAASEENHLERSSDSGDLGISRQDLICSLFL